MRDHGSFFFPGIHHANLDPFAEPIFLIFFFFFAFLSPSVSVTVVIIFANLFGVGAYSLL